MKALEVAKRFLVEEKIGTINETQYSVKFIYNKREYIIRCLPSRLSDYIFHLYAENIYPITKENFTEAIKIANMINTECSVKCSINADSLLCTLHSSVIADKYEFIILLEQMERQTEVFIKAMEFNDMLDSYARKLLSY